MVYGYEAGVDVWPGLRQILYYAAGGSPPTGGSFWWNLYETQFALDYKVSLGDMRENAKMLGGLALAYLLDTDSTVRTHALEALDGTLNGMWIPGIRQHKWSGTNVQPGQDPCSTGYQVVGNQAGTVYATVTNGSANVSIHGTCYQVGAGSITVSGTSVTGDSNTAFTHTFKTGDTLTVTTTSGAETKAISSITNDHAMVTAAFTGTATLAGYYTNGLTEYNVGLAGGDPIPVWFCSTCFGNNQFGNNGIRLIAENSDLDGDAVAYYVSAITNQTNIVLATPYVDAACNSGCNKVMEIARTAGVGAIDYMSAMMAGVLASWVYQAFVMAGPSYAADAAATKTLVQDFAIGIPSSYKNDAGDVWGATIFPGCILFPTSDNCIGANLISGEFLKAMSAIYAIAPTPALKTLGDNGNNYLWGRPDWTRPAGIPLNGPCSPFTNCYLWEATDNSEGLGGFMITYGAAETAKWFGYYWGYGFGLSWPAVRELSPPIITTGGKILTKGKSVIH